MVTAYSKHDPDQLRAVANKHQAVFQRVSMVILQSEPYLLGFLKNHFDFEKSKAVTLAIAIKLKLNPSEIPTLKTTAGQWSLTVVTACVTVEKLRRTATMTANT